MGYARRKQGQGLSLLRIERMLFGRYAELVFLYFVRDVAYYGKRENFVHARDAQLEVARFCTTHLEVHCLHWRRIEHGTNRL